MLGRGNKLGTSFKVKEIEPGGSADFENGAKMKEPRKIIRGGIREGSLYREERECVCEEYVWREEKTQRVIIGELGSSKALYPSRHSLSWPATIVR